MMKEFYPPFKIRVDEKADVDRAKRRLGIDPKTGREVSVRVGKFGSYVQIGVAEDEDKPLFASIPPTRKMFEITLEDALTFFELPRTVGQNENGEDVTVNVGKFGPYVQIAGQFFSIPEGEDPFDVTLERAFEIAVLERERKAQSVIQDLGDFQVLNGRYGPYIKKGSQNYNIPKGLDPASLDRETLEKFMTDGGNGRRRQHVIHDFDGIQIIAGKYGPYIKNDGNNYKIPPEVEAATLDKAACEKIMKENPATNKKK